MGHHHQRRHRQLPQEPSPQPGCVCAPRGAVAAPCSRHWRVPGVGGADAYGGQAAHIWYLRSGTNTSLMTFLPVSLILHLGQK